MSVVQESLTQSLHFGGTIFTFLLIFFFVLCLYHFWFQSLRSTQLGNKLPGDTPLPLIGNAFLLLNKNPTELMRTIVQLFERRGNIIRFWFGNKLIVGLGDPRDIELVLSSNIHLEKSSEYKFFEPWLGDGLLISKGERWRSHRKMIAPTFHQSILKTFIPTFNKNATDLIKQLSENAVGKMCDVHDYMSEATVDVLMETVMGVPITKDSKSSFQYAKAVMDMCSILHIRHAKFWLRSNFIFALTKLFQKQKQCLKIIHSLTDRVIKQKKKNYFDRMQDGEISLLAAAIKDIEEDDSGRDKDVVSYGSALKDDLDVDDDSLGEKKRLAFLDFMVETSQTEGNRLNDRDIREQVNTIMFEGHDTTAAASSFFLCILGVYPEIQEKVYQELEMIFQGTDRLVTFNDTLEMKYLERVLLETLRLYPPVPIIARILNNELKLASESYVLPKGTTVVIPQYCVHRSPKYYDNPNEFNPDNFLPEKCQQRHYYSYIPFSAGPRSCVGRKYAMLKLKILLAQIVRKFKIESIVTEKDFKLQADIILKRTDGFRITLEERIR